MEVGQMTGRAKAFLPQRACQGFTTTDPLKQIDSMVPYTWGEDSTYKGQGCLLYLSEVKKIFLFVFLRVFGLKKSAAGAFTVLFGVLSKRRKYERI